MLSFVYVFTLSRLFRRFFLFAVQSHHFYLISLSSLCYVFRYHQYYTMCTDTNCIQLIKAHSSAVTALNYTVATGLLASAGRDNYIHLYNISITPAQGNNIISLSLKNFLILYNDDI